MRFAAVCVCVCVSVCLSVCIIVYYETRTAVSMSARANRRFCVGVFVNRAPYKTA